MSAVLLEREGAIARIILNRPDAGNAIDMALARDLAAVAEAVAGDATVRCVVLTGAGRIFCAGGDVGAMAAAEEGVSRYLRMLADTLHGAVVTLATMPKPLLVLVNGAAAGAGLSLAILGDVVIAARSASFTAAYTAVGLTPDGGMSWLLPRMVGMRRAQAMILTNQRVTAEEAERIDLITRLAGDDDLAAQGATAADGLVHAPTAAIGAARSLILEGAGSAFRDHLDREAATIASTGAQAESREGIAAYLSRRKPSFPGA